jgi:hypothetical protein
VTDRAALRRFCLHARFAALRQRTGKPATTGFPSCAGQLARILLTTKVSHQPQEFIMPSLTVLRSTLFCLSAVLAPLALASPLAPFVLTAPGTVEIKYTGYQAVSKDTGATGKLKESTFAAGYMTSINEVGNASNSYWQQGQNNQSISFMMYGVGDASKSPGTGGAGQRVYSKGCTNATFGCDGKIHLDFYIDKLTGGTNPGFGLGGLKASDRQGFNKIKGITDGELLMSWEFTPGLISNPVSGLSDPAFDALTTTLVQEQDGLPTPAFGTGTYLANCVGGPACLYFRTGSNAGGADFFGINTMTRMLSRSMVGQNGWSYRIADPVIAQVELPEPGVLALLAAGLLGLAGIRRRAPCQG